MDKRTSYYRLKSLLMNWKSDTISFHELQGLISAYISSTPKTIEQHMRTMAFTNLIKDIGESKFQINKNGNMQ